MRVSLVPEVVAHRRNRVRELTLEGQTAAVIAAELGITERTVQRLRQQSGATQRASHPMTPAELRAAESLLDDGCSYTEVGRTLGRGTRTIRDHFPGRGWPRPQCGLMGAWTLRARRQMREVYPCVS